MISINPYLNFKGDTEAAFKFYKSVFGGDFSGGMQRFKDTPEGDKVPANEKDMIMHVALPVGKGNMIMGTDVLESMGQKVTIGNNFHLSVSTESEAEANKIFEGLSAGGTVTMPLADMFWGDYFGMCTDKFGVQWMVGFSRKRAG